MKSATATCRGLLEGLSHALRNAQRRSVVQLVTWGLVVLGGCGGAAGQSPALNFQGAQWIWYTADPKVPVAAFPGDSCYCRVPFVLPETTAIKAAEVIITADNLYTLHLNGRVAGASEDNPDLWNRPKRFDVTSRLLPGRNMVAVEGVNTAPGPAGLIMKLVAETSDGQRFTLVSDASWKCSDQATPHWEQAVFDDATWQPPRVVGEHGVAPWGQLTVPAQAERPLDDVAAPGTVPADFGFPEGMVFLGDDCSLHHFPVCFHMNNNSRAYPEWDLPCPSLMGRKLYALAPVMPDATPRLLLDAGKRGAIGSPSVSYDGQHVYVALAATDDDFFHIYRVPVAGGPPRQLTRGAFHDIDPAELPDGRIVFTSTRIGSFEEYHQPPSRSLFVMRADGSEIQPLTFTPIGDNEPKVMADGRIAFVRSDNFFDRAKVETQIHAIHPDGTAGQTEAGAEVGADYGVRLRALGFGSPAPLPDGRLAVLSQMGNLIGRPGNIEQANRRLPPNLTDISPLPDGRLLCTTKKAIAVLDPNNNQLVPVYQTPTGKIHSPVYLGPRPRPPVLASQVTALQETERPQTGILFCQSVFRTRKGKADWSQVRAIRILGGLPLKTRSSHSYVVHAGIDVIELGTVPLAADGSFYVEVPANMPLAMQAVDAEGRSELNEMSWIYVRPGETRSCVGCHQRRQSAPAQKAGFAEALRAPPLKLLGQGEPHKFRGNNSGVTGMMDLQFERFREVASIDLHAHRPWAANAGPQGWAREVGRLLDQLGGPRPDLQLSAAGRLAIFRERGAAPALAVALRDGNRELRVAAALALAACGTRASLPPLAEALADDDPLVSLAATVALENLTGHEEPLPAFGPPKVRTPHAAAWRDWLAAHPADAIEQTLLSRLADPDRVRQRRTIVALGHIGGEPARAALREFVAQHKDQHPTPPWNGGNRIDSYTYAAASPLNPRLMQEAIRALGYLRDTQAIPLLGELVAKNTEGIQVDKVRPPPKRCWWTVFAAWGTSTSTSAGTAIIRRCGPATRRPCITWLSRRWMRSPRNAAPRSCPRPSARCPPTRTGL
ncbi:MAG: HEAT repeat domain-containing protein [Planctomycetota bacterium]|nr:HEAT repeat domain-containing protein [Planctomycetota bacterium]